MIGIISRQALYKLAWSKPLSKLGPQFGISDTALRKKCKKALLPLPTAGYWAKKAANKPTHQPPMPLRQPGSSDYIEIGTANHFNHYSREVVLHRPFPPPPDFDESLESVHKSITEKVGHIPYPILNTRSHPLISRLLNDDTQRRKEEREQSYSWLKPRFTDALQKRKLRIINALFLGSNKVSGKPYISISKYDDDIRDASIQFGECSISIKLDPITTKITVKGKKIEQTHFKLTLGGYSQFDMEIPCWEDSDEQKIENCLSDIIIEMVLGAERKYRAHEQWKFEYFFKRREEYIEEDIQRQLEEERLIREEAERLQQARIDELLIQANNLQKAQTIRDYVSTIQSKHEDNKDKSAIDSWAKWALEQADSLDPIKQRTFMKQLNDLSFSESGYVNQ